MALPSFLNINTTTIPVESGAMSIMYTIKKDRSKPLMGYV